MKNINLMIGIIIISFIVLIGVLSFFYTPHDITQMNVTKRFSSPSFENILGTDNFGRDILSRIMVGTQTALFVGFVSVAIGLVFGVFIGALSGYLGGIFDEIIMRFMDAMLAFPGILFALMFVSIFGVGIKNTIIAIGIMSIPSFARITRSGVIQHKNFEYVKNAKIKGAGSLRIIFFHILPNILSPILVAGSLGFSSAILSEAGLSYLGLGVQPPYPSWGRMLNESQIFITISPWYAIAPGLMISLTVLGFNFLGDGLRDLQDKRKK
ncbi:ABC transporter permease [Oceanotoga sp. DSM 15011]|jgi:peptide/nickel transport system permease protein|uniref:Peptide/nickel transport system permease protein n=1 Tax=Oceanotoga teriensis TaxID=515440 RepID=A0AA45HHR4_9BACT|nr:MULTISPECIES: ABC transporter permease [Oceanotoga]MDO7976556.1 ABC transporter permease [Oceanotoga teriensis]PWJ88277.1 peptide/nickel transport system permease protein [Oceanotoga teriensis]UYO99272.1 ABC transporter permease [Oceanotoga sp. DSM 15011]